MGVGKFDSASSSGGSSASSGAPVRPAVAKRSFRNNLIAFSETFKLALDALRAHKLRSFLTLLGVILAVLTLVAVMSVVSGLNFYVADRVANLGANTYVVDRFGIITSNDEWVKAQRRPLLTLDEYQFLHDNMKLAERVAATGWVTKDLRYGNMLLENTNVMGASSDYAELRNIGLHSGRYITEADDLHHSPICFIGNDVVKKFFPNVDPIGKTIRAGSHSYEIVGVAEAIGTAFGQSQDNFILIPLVTYYKEWHTQADWLAIFVQAPNAEMIPASEDEARMLMRARRHLAPKQDDNFGLVEPSAIMELYNTLTGSLASGSIFVVGIFLVIGGIVIMNIMLASVTERTREIGVRKSLGATRRDVLLQFLVESAVMATIGGILGVVVAVVISFAVGRFTPFPMSLPIGWVIASVLVAAKVGLFFGVYPAYKASKLNPIEALRFEA